MIFNGRASSKLSRADVTVSGAGRIHDRKVRQGRIIRPCFNAASSRSGGRATCASGRFQWASSARIGAGHFSASAASGAKIKPSSVGVVAVAAARWLFVDTTRSGGCGVAAFGAVARATAGEVGAANPVSLTRFSNGPVISSDTVTVFRADEAASNLELNRFTTSFSGSATGSASCSGPVRNRLGAAARNWPKRIFTEPVASCGRTCPTGMEMVACPSSAMGRVNVARKSPGNFSRIGGRGNSNSSPVVEAGGALTDAVDGTGAMDCVDGANSASSPSKRCSHPRRNPANLIFTLLGITFISAARAVKSEFNFFSSNGKLSRKRASWDVCEYGLIVQFVGILVFHCWIMCPQFNAEI